MCVPELGNSIHNLLPFSYSRQKQSSTLHNYLPNDARDHSLPPHHHYKISPSTIYSLITLLSLSTYMHSHYCVQMCIRDSIKTPPGPTRNITKTQRTIICRSLIYQIYSWRPFVTPNNTTGKNYPLQHLYVYTISPLSL